MRRSTSIFKENMNSNSLLDERVIEESSLELDSTSTDIFVEPSIKVMPTLPKAFKSLVDTPIDITDENRKPENIVELLGNALGINDYKTNMASFWFLDFIAFQVLQYEPILDSHDRSVLVSWLAGEMKLIQDKTLSREAFFQEMAEIFIDNSEKLERGHTVLHWDLMLVKHSEDDITIPEDTEQESNEREESTVKITRRRISSREQKRSASKDGKKFSENTLRKKDESENNINDSGEDPTRAKNNSHNILDVIIEATYSMYGNNFHYALIVAAFVKPVLLHEYTLPFVPQTPSSPKISEVEKYNENKVIEKDQDSVVPRKAKEINKKTKDSKKTKKKSKDAETIKVAPKHQ